MGPMLYLNPPEAAGIGYGVPSHFPAEINFHGNPIPWKFSGNHSGLPLKWKIILKLFWKSYRVYPTKILQVAIKNFFGGKM